MNNTAIIPYASLDEGIEARFRGVERDADGTPVGEMIDVVLTIPPLNLFNLKRLRKHFDALQDVSNVDSMGHLVDILIPALEQNYTGVPRWLIEQSINPANFADIVNSLMDVSGLKRKAIAEKKALATAPSL